jgi:hypothetical protein
MEDGRRNFAKIIEVNNPFGVIYSINSEAACLFNTNCVLHVNCILAHSWQTPFGKASTSNCYLLHSCHSVLQTQAELVAYLCQLTSTGCTAALVTLLHIVPKIHCSHKII